MPPAHEQDSDSSVVLLNPLSVGRPTFVIAVPSPPPPPPPPSSSAQSSLLSSPPPPLLSSTTTASSSSSLSAPSLQQPYQPLSAAPTASPKNPSSDRRNQNKESQDQSEAQPPLPPPSPSPPEWPPLVVAAVLAVAAVVGAALGLVSCLVLRPFLCQQWNRGHGGVGIGGSRDYIDNGEEDGGGGGGGGDGDGVDGGDGADDVVGAKVSSSSFVVTPMLSLVNRVPSVNMGGMERVHGSDQPVSREVQIQMQRAKELQIRIDSNNRDAKLGLPYSVARPERFRVPVTRVHHPDSELTSKIVNRAPNRTVYDIPESNKKPPSKKTNLPSVTTKIPVNLPRRGNSNFSRGSGGCCSSSSADGGSSGGWSSASTTLMTSSTTAASASTTTSLSTTTSNL